jgi:hypothetical protein
MEIHDFGLMASQERKKSDDEDFEPTTTKKLRPADEE